jgi:hypothetical protein
VPNNGHNRTPHPTSSVESNSQRHYIQVELPLQERVRLNIAAAVLDRSAADLVRETLRREVGQILHDHDLDSGAVA